MLKPKRKSRNEKMKLDYLMALARAALMHDGIAYSGNEGIDDLLAKMPDYQRAGLKKQAAEEASRSNATDDKWQTPDFATS